MIQKIKDVIDIQDAMDNLSAIASIDLDNPPPIGILKNLLYGNAPESFSPDLVPRV